MLCRQAAHFLAILDAIPPLGRWRRAQVHRGQRPGKLLPVRQAVDAEGTARPGGAWWRVRHWPQDQRGRDHNLAFRDVAPIHGADRNTITRQEAAAIELLLVRLVSTPSSASRVCAGSADKYLSLDPSVAKHDIQLAPSRTNQSVDVFVVCLLEPLLALAQEEHRRLPGPLLKIQLGIFRRPLRGGGGRAQQAASLLCARALRECQQGGEEVRLRDHPPIRELFGADEVPPRDVLGQAPLVFHTRRGNIESVKEVVPRFFHDGNAVLELNSEVQMVADLPHRLDIGRIREALQA
mmetsp:Transcript_9491/g.33619  ORF Transcript_9491/g.33619 Transcript_9491/m.33619 type:complete len:294 (+) Transcript_9491:920-1801(+)